MTYGKGESGIKSIPHDKYFEALDDEVVLTVVSASCKHFKVSVPDIVLIPENGNWRGWYKPKTKTVEVSRLMFGLVIHETAHHINRELNGYHRNNGHYVHHGYTFKVILQELHDLWR